MRRDGVSWEKQRPLGQTEALCVVTLQRRNPSVGWGVSQAQAPQLASSVCLGWGGNRLNWLGPMISSRTPLRAPGELPTLQATPLRPQSANELRAWSAGEGRILDAAAKHCTLSLRLER